MCEALDRGTKGGPVTMGRLCVKPWTGEPRVRLSLHGEVVCEALDRGTKGAPVTMGRLWPDNAALGVHDIEPRCKRGVL